MQWHRHTCTEVGREGRWDDVKLHCGRVQEWVFNIHYGSGLNSSAALLIHFLQRSGYKVNTSSIEWEGNLRVPWVNLDWSVYFLILSYHNCLCPVLHCMCLSPPKKKVDIMNMASLFWQSYNLCCSEGNYTTHDIIYLLDVEDTCVKTYGLKGWICFSKDIGQYLIWKI